MQFHRGVGLVILGAALPWATAAQSRDALGVYDHWAAFRDAQPHRCYAISAPDKHRSTASAGRPYVTIANWPERGIRAQVHVRLTHALTGQGADLMLDIDGSRFPLVGAGFDAWAPDATVDAAIVAALRTGRVMTIGRNQYPLKGAASAIDAAALGCARTP